MGLFDKVFTKKGSDGLPESFSALYKATDYSQKGYDVHYGFRCLEKMYKIGHEAALKGEMSTGEFVGAIKADLYFPRIENLAKVYETGEYWYDNEDEGRRYHFKVCEPDMVKYYQCYASMSYAASKLTNNFTKEYMLKESVMRQVPEYVLKTGIGYSQGYLKSVSDKVKSKSMAVSFLDTAFDLCCRGYGLTTEYVSLYGITEKPSEVACLALEELIALKDFLEYRSLSSYVKKAQESKINLPIDLLQKINEIEELE